MRLLYHRLILKKKSQRTRWCLSVKDLLHSRHLYGRSAVCSRRCVLRQCLSAKLLPHSGQMCGRSPECIRRCVDRWCFIKNVLPHSSHVWGRVFATTSPATCDLSGELDNCCCCGDGHVPTVCVLILPVLLGTSVQNYNFVLQDITHEKYLTQLLVLVRAKKINILCEYSLSHLRVFNVKLKEGKSYDFSKCKG